MNFTITIQINTNLCYSKGSSEKLELVQREKELLSVSFGEAEKTTLRAYLDTKLTLRRKITMLENSVNDYQAKIYNVNLLLQLRDARIESKNKELETKEDQLHLVAEKSGKMQQELQAVKNEVSELRCTVARLTSLESILKTTDSLVCKHFRENSSDSKDDFTKNHLVDTTIKDLINNFQKLADPSPLCSLTIVLEKLAEITRDQAHVRAENERNSEDFPWRTHDAHGQFLEPAMESIIRKMRQQQERADKYGEPQGLHIITGWGKPGENKGPNYVPKIKPALMAYLGEQHIESRVNPRNLGCVSIVFHPKPSEQRE